MDEWISVNDRKPERGLRVEVCNAIRSDRYDLDEECAIRKRAINAIAKARGTE